MSSPIWLGNGNTPTRTDSEWKVLQRILGALNDLIIAQGGDPTVEPTWLSGGSVPNEHDTKWTILQRILGATRQISSGGGVGAVYSGHGAPAVVPTASAAIYYDLDDVNRMWLWDGAAWF